MQLIVSNLFDNFICNALFKGDKTFEKMRGAKTFALDLYFENGTVVDPDLSGL